MIVVIETHNHEGWYVSFFSDSIEEAMAEAKKYKSGYDDPGRTWPPRCSIDSIIMVDTETKNVYESFKPFRAKTQLGTLTKSRVSYGAF